MSETQTAVRNGVLAIIGVTLAFASMDAAVKALSPTFDPVFIVWARYIGQAIGTLVLFAPKLSSIVRTGHLPIQILRSALLFTATVCFFSALAIMPLAEVAALAQFSPLLLTALAALVLREHVGIYRWIAVVLGFCGALIIVHPGTGTYGLSALLPLGGALAFASFGIATRFLGGVDSVWTTFFYTSAVGAVLASLAVPFVWKTPALQDAPLLVAAALFGAVGQGLLILAMRFAPASLLAPFLYVQLIWAAMLGYFIFSEVPQPATIAGGAVIVLAGLFVHWRERVRGT